MPITMDSSPGTNARKKILTTKGLPTALVTEAQALPDQMSEADYLLMPLDIYLKASERY
jgi:hypothetical protein